MKNKADALTWRRRGKIFAVILSILMIRVWETVQAQRLERRLKIMRVEADRLTFENGRLQMQIHQYEAPSALEAKAKKDFLMMPLDPSHRVGVQP